MGVFFNQFCISLVAFDATKLGLTEESVNRRDNWEVNEEVLAVKLSVFDVDVFT